jgi:hypothetical protein
MGGACSTDVEEMHTQVLSVNLKERDYLVDLGIGGRIILKGILKFDVIVLIGFISASNSRRLEIRRHRVARIQPPTHRSNLVLCCLRISIVFKRRLLSNYDYIASN